MHGFWSKFYKKNEILNSQTLRKTKGEIQNFDIGSYRRDHGASNKNAELSSFKTLEGDIRFSTISNLSIQGHNWKRS